MALRNRWEQILDQIRSLPLLLPPWLTNPRKLHGSPPELLLLITLLVERAASHKAPCSKRILRSVVKDQHREVRPATLGCVRCRTSPCLRSGPTTHLVRLLRHLLQDQNHPRALQFRFGANIP